MTLMRVPSEKNCYHCGNECDPKTPISVEEKNFCCLGCKAVYEILSENNLDNYYSLETSPGVRPENVSEKYHFLDNEKIVQKLLEFNDGNTQIVTLFIPTIHCSSCIWVLENLHKLNKNVIHSLVNFPKKSVQISFHSDKTSLKEVVLLLAHIGYPPYISLDDYQKKETDKQDKTLLYKLGVAGFAFGNVMLLSFPEYFENDEFWLNQYKFFFRWLSFALSFPVMFYAASDYFISAYKGLRNGILNIDVPLALGIAAMFVRSLYDIVTDTGQGFFDSLNGLVFFLLIGRFFQQKTYNFLSFERDYKSYFPIGITKLTPTGEESIQVYDIQVGDRLLIRNEELIPTDAILIKGEAHIDYSFVTGEAKVVEKNSGDKLFAGGKQKGTAIEVEVTKTISQSYLTQLWSNEIFQKKKTEGIKNLTDRIGKYFTIIILFIAIFGFIWWYRESPLQAFHILTAVLIIACPCALAMSAPFTLGNMLRIFGKHQFYLKDTQVLERLANINSLIFDKTGTITTAHKNTISFEGEALSLAEKQFLKTALRNSNHPLSRQLYDFLAEVETISLTDFQEEAGKGISARTEGNSLKLGSANFVGAPVEKDFLQTAVFVNFNGNYKGKFRFQNAYRAGIQSFFSRLTPYKLAILSGDNASEEKNLRNLLPPQTELKFNQNPDDKLAFIEKRQNQGEKVLMAGDGLNDAGALKQSDIGVAVAENINVFSPACDAILAAEKLVKLDTFLLLSKQSIRIIKGSFVISLLYNVLGISFAITGYLSPVVAAILMPLSSISIVAFTTIATNLVGRKLR